MCAKLGCVLQIMSKIDYDKPNLSKTSYLFSVQHDDSKFLSDLKGLNIYSGMKDAQMHNYLVYFSETILLIYDLPSEWLLILLLLHFS